MTTRLDTWVYQVLSRTVHPDWTAEWTFLGEGEAHKALASGTITTITTIITVTTLTNIIAIAMIVNVTATLYLPHLHTHYMQ